MTNSIAYAEDGVPSKVVVRISTSVWSDDSGIRIRRDVRFLRRKCQGVNFVEEDLGAIGAEGVLDRCPELMTLGDGIYKVGTKNERRDYETGLVDDYDYQITKL